MSYKGKNNDGARGRSTKPDDPLPCPPDRPRFGGFRLPQLELGSSPRGLLAIGDMIINGLIWSATIIGMLSIVNKIMEAGVK